MKKTVQAWKTCLTPEAFRILREKGTEIPFTGKYVFNKKKGAYVCAGCGQVLFRSATKFESGTGWPSFWAPASQEKVVLKEDTTRGMRRTEGVCKKCGGHLGHVFEDGPKPTGLRYCINSAALHFKEEKKKNPKAKG